MRMRKQVRPAIGGCVIGCLRSMLQLLLPASHSLVGAPVALATAGFDINMEPNDLQQKQS